MSNERSASGRAYNINELSVFLKLSKAFNVQQAFKRCKLKINFRKIFILNKSSKLNFM